jgi:hypothetical protein
MRPIPHRGNSRLFVLCANEVTGRLFVYRPLAGIVKFLVEIHHPRRSLDFAKHLAEELSALFSSETDNQLLVCAEPRFLDRLKEQFSIDTLKRIVGTVNIDLVDANESDLVAYVLDFQETDQAA